MHSFHFDTWGELHSGRQLSLTITGIACALAEDTWNIYPEIVSGTVSSGVDGIWLWVPPPPLATQSAFLTTKITSQEATSS